MCGAGRVIDGPCRWRMARKDVGRTREQKDEQPQQLPSSRPPNLLCGGGGGDQCYLGELSPHCQVYSAGTTVRSRLMGPAGERRKRKQHQKKKRVAEGWEGRPWESWGARRDRRRTDVRVPGGRHDRAARPYLRRDLRRGLGGRGLRGLEFVRLLFWFGVCPAREAARGRISILEPEPRRSRTAALTWFQVQPAAGGCEWWL